MQLISIYETFLYYCCLLLVARNIIGVTPRIMRLWGSFLAFIPLLIITFSGTRGFQSIAYICFGGIQFLLIHLIYPDIKTYRIVFFYILIYCINVITISLITTIYNRNLVIIDLMVNTTTAGLCLLICLSKYRIKLRQVIEWTPRHTLIIISLLLVSLTFISVLIFGYQDSTVPDIWGRLSQIVLICMQFSACIVLPVLAVNSISSNRLKALTKNYEQQIQAQAEHYKNLAAANFETRRFKHDFKNMSIAIEKLLADGQQEQALALLQKYNNTLNTPGAFHPAFDTGNSIADALLTDKSEKASVINAEITFNGAIPQDALSPTDLCVILGNTLDNAIEACQKLDPKTYKTIAIHCNCSSGFLFLSISNPVSEKVIIHDNYISTTKENKTLHGFGLYSLHSVVTRYDGEVRLSSTDDCFTVDIDMCVTTLLKHESCLLQ